MNMLELLIIGNIFILLIFFEFSMMNVLQDPKDEGLVNLLQHLYSFWVLDLQLQIFSQKLKLQNIIKDILTFFFSFHQNGRRNKERYDSHRW